MADDRRRSLRPGPAGRAPKLVALALLLGCRALAAQPAETEPAAAGTVVLLHGFARTRHSMDRLAEALETAGYRTVNLGYPTLRPFDELAAMLAGELELCCAEESGAVHFVTHSMGGILIRYLLAERRLPNLGRVVMLSPPNRGTPIVDRFRRYSILDALLGPAARELGTGPESLPNRLGPVDFPLGVIAGDRSINPLFSHLIPGDDDGQVAVDRARVEGMSDFLVVPCSHSFIMNDSRVIAETVRFLRHGRFSADAEAATP